MKNEKTWQEIKDELFEKYQLPPEAVDHSKRYPLAYPFAKAIFEISDTSVKLNPIPGSAYPTKAKRPAFSVMDKSKIKSTFNLTIPYWRESLVKCIATIKNN